MLLFEWPYRILISFVDDKSCSYAEEGRSCYNSILMSQTGRRCKSQPMISYQIVFTRRYMSMDNIKYGIQQLQLEMFVISVTNVASVSFTSAGGSRMVECTEGLQYRVTAAISSHRDVTV